MNQKIFDTFFRVGEIKIGPTVMSLNTHGDTLGKVYLHPTDKNLFFSNEDYVVISINKFYCSYVWKLYDILPYIGISESELDRYMCELYIDEWEKSENPQKPRIDYLKQRLIEEDNPPRKSLIRQLFNLT